MVRLVIAALHWAVRKGMGEDENIGQRSRFRGIGVLMVGVMG